MDRECIEGWLIAIIGAIIVGFIVGFLVTSLTR